MAVGSVVVLLSGGIDSSTMLAWLVNRGYFCSPLCVDYGQLAYEQERKHATRVAHRFGLQVREVSVASIGKMHAAALTDSTVSEPFFPNRNLLLLCLGSIMAYDQGASGVALGVHQASRYPDCSGEFIDKIQGLLEASLGHKVAIIAPFSTVGRKSIVSLAQRLRLPLRETYSCLRGEERHCGRCESCLDRSRDMHD